MSFSIIPSPRLAKPVSRWSVGIITAPREEPTLEATAQSMVRAGWESPRIFAEPDTSIPDSIAHMPVSQRSEVVGAWSNYYLGLQEMLVRDPMADAYMLVQDDCLFAEHDGDRSLREYLEQSLWPSVEHMGVVSIYCAMLYNKTEPGWYALPHPWIWGALAFIWPRETLLEFLGSTALHWRVSGKRWKDRKDPKWRGYANIDTCVGRWAEQANKAVWYCAPSLVSHIGDTSAIWGPGRKAAGARKEAVFLGDMIRCQTGPS